ncbi:MAG TPA: hypothetical protein VIC85_16290 [Ktedonobacterales bacterium]
MGHGERDASFARWEAPATPVGASRAAGPPPGRRLPAFLRPPAVWFTGVAAVGCVVLAALAVLALLPPPTARTTTAVLPPARATNTLLPQPQPMYTVSDPLPTFALPTFHDWRAAYLAADGTVHISTLDGQTDLAGPALPLNTADTTNSAVANANAPTAQSITSLAVSPNGHELAYVEQAPQPGGTGVAPPSGDLDLEPLGANAAWMPMRVYGQVMNLGGWSPDSSTLAISAVLGNASNIYLLNPTVPDQSGLIGHAIEPGVTVFPGFASNGALQSAHVLGWIDNTHLLLMIDLSTGFSFPPLGTASVAPAVAAASGAMGGERLGAGAPGLGPRALGAPLVGPLSPPRSSNAPQTLATVNITTGAGFTIATIPAGSVAALSPDGTQVVVQNSCVVSCIAGTLTTEVVDTHTGAVHSLPQSDKAIAPSAAFVWNPTGPSFAATVATNQQTPADWKVAVVDTQTDSATTVRSGAFIIGWSPDGQTLLEGDATGVGSTATKAWLVAPGASATPVLLRQRIVAFIGWVRTG